MFGMQRSYPQQKPGPQFGITLDLFLRGLLGQAAYDSLSDTGNASLFVLQYPRPFTESCAKQ